MKSYQLTIIVPIYNEEDNIERLSSKLLEYFENSSVLTKALLIDDGSKDKSLEWIKKVSAKHNNIEYISFEENRGLSAAIKAGFDHVKTPLTGYIDADLQTNPEDFDLLLPHIYQYDLVTGNRNHSRKDSFIKNMSSVIANNIRRFFTHDGMDDTGCPLKIIKTKYAKDIPMFKGLHRFLPAMILLQNGKIKQVDIQNYPRMAGISKFGLWNRLLSPLIDCFVYVWMKKKYINYYIKEQS